MPRKKGFLYALDQSTINIMKQDGTILKSFLGFAEYADLDVDIYGNIWGLTTINTIHKIKYNGTALLNVISAYGTACYGIAIDSRGFLWQVAKNPSPTIYKIEQDGTLLYSFSSPGPGTYPAGMSVDNQGFLWMTDYQADQVYKLDQYGTVLDQFATPGGQSKGLDVDDHGFIWIGDDADNKIYKLDKNGTILYDFAPGWATVNGIAVG